MRGHTNGVMTMGQEFPISQLINQKLDTRCSTKSEIVGVDKLMPSVLLTRIFL